MGFRQHSRLLSVSVIYSSGLVNRLSNFVLVVNSGGTYGTGLCGRLTGPITGFDTSFYVSYHGQLVRGGCLQVQYRYTNGYRSLALPAKRLIQVALFRSTWSNRFRRFNRTLFSFFFQRLNGFRAGDCIIMSNRVARRYVILGSGASTSFYHQRVISALPIGVSVTAI